MLLQISHCLQNLWFLVGHSNTDVDSDSARVRVYKFLGVFGLSSTFDSMLNFNGEPVVMGNFGWHVLSCFGCDGLN